MRLGFIGYGDAARAVAKGISGEGSSGTMKAWSRSIIKNEEPDENGVICAGSREELIRDSDVIFVMVPGPAAVMCAEASAEFLDGTKLYVDLCTGSPHDMKLVEEIIMSTGARFADGAMMDTVPKYQHKVPITLCGKDGAEAEKIMTGLGMQVTYLGKEPGKADAVKLLRSMYTKAHLACAFEMLEAAEHYGVADFVMEGLAKTMDDKTFTEGMDGRCAGGVIHASRRAHELDSAAQMLEEDGLPAYVSRAGARKLREIGELDIRSNLTHGKPKTWQEAMEYVRERKEAAENTGKPEKTGEDAGNQKETMEMSESRESMNYPDRRKETGEIK